jgi:hypothetical protein
MGLQRELAIHKAKSDGKVTGTNPKNEGSGGGSGGAPPITVNVHMPSSNKKIHVQKGKDGSMTGTVEHEE